jgi:uncharacterized phage-like protein YoqJ
VILAGTGHRPARLGFGRMDGYHPLVRDRLQALARAALLREGPDVVISGMALGWDTALAMAALGLGLPLHAYVPFRGQESRWNADDQVLYHWILGCAAEVVVVSPGGYSAWKMQTRNEAMVDASGTVLALWNGQDGGTANCVRYAERRGVPVRNLWGSWRRHADAG